MTQADRLNSEVNQQIEKMYNDGKSEIEIIYYVSMTFGKGELYVRKRLRMLEKFREFIEKKASRKKKLVPKDERSTEEILEDVF